VRLKQGVTTFNHLEHVLIRKQFPDEPRIHASLVCAGLGCPKMHVRAMTAVTVDAHLEQDMTDWVNDPTRNVIDPVNGRATLSKLFNSYADDFGGAVAVINYVDRYTVADLSKMVVKFSSDYDWTLNVIAPSTGQWVTVIGDFPILTPQDPEIASSIARKGDVYEVIQKGDGTSLIERPFDGGKAWISQNDIATYVAQPDRKKEAKK